MAKQAEQNETVAWGFNDIACTKLVKAAAEGDTATLKKLIDDGFDINQPDSQGNTALVWALLHDHTEGVRILLEKNADVDLPRGTLPGALHAAMTDGSVEELKMVMNASKKFDPQSLDAKLGLLSAVYLKRIDNSKYLIEKGVPVNFKDDRGDFPLYLAAKELCPPLVKLLIEVGANVNEVDNKGQTALRVVKSRYPANDKEVPQIIAMLKKAGAKS